MYPHKPSRHEPREHSISMERLLHGYAKAVGNTFRATGMLLWKSLHLNGDLLLSMCGLR